MLLGDLQLLFGQYPGTHLAVEREHCDAVAHRQHQLGLRAIHAVAGRGLETPRLQEVVLADAVVVAHLAQHREDGADADVDVDVAGAVERVVQQQVFALRLAVRNGVDGVYLLAGQCR